MQLSTVKKYLALTVGYTLVVAQAIRNIAEVDMDLSEANFLLMYFFCPVAILGLSFLGSYFWKIEMEQALILCVVIAIAFLLYRNFRLCLYLVGLAPMIAFGSLGGAIKRPRKQESKV